MKYRFSVFFLGFILGIVFCGTFVILRAPYLISESYEMSLMNHLLLQKKIDQASNLEEVSKANHDILRSYMNLAVDVQHKHQDLPKIIKKANRMINEHTSQVE